MNLVVAAALAVAAGWGAKTLWDTKKEKDQAEADARARAMGMRAAKLVTDVPYTVQLTVVKAETANQATMASVIKTTFEQFGFEVTSTPTPQNTAEASNFLAGRSSTWILQGTWRRTDASAIPSGPSWLGMAVAYEMPTKS